MAVLQARAYLARQRPARLARTCKVKVVDPARQVSLYLHIPYCVKKCGYCDFNSYAGARAGEMAAYVAALEQEMAGWAERLAAAGPYTVPTCFVGGGTPTLLPGELLARVLTRARKLFPLAPDAEVTVEANPGTVDVESDKLAQARSAGANRLSFGVQAFQDRVLLGLDRFHSAAEVYAAVAAARAAGFANLNLDLMYGLPGQDLADWQETLREAVGLAPEHISAYSLMIEAGTSFHVLYHRGQLELPAEAVEDAMDQAAGEVLAAAGYERYEVSNYTRPGRQCRHNLVYWRNGEWLGLGAGAHSHLDGRRFWKVKLPPAYIRLLRDGQSPEDGGETPTAVQQMAETMIMGLRLTDGVAEREFHRRFGRSLDQAYGGVGARLEADGLLTRSGGAWRLTERGRRLGNRVWAAFLDPVI